MADSGALVHEEFASQLPAKTFSGQGSIALTSYAPDQMIYTARVDGPQLELFNEMWYGPDKGWTTTIDGQAAELIQADYALLALVLPGGE